MSQPIDPRYTTHDASLSRPSPAGSAQHSRPREQPSTTDVAKEQAGDVATTARDAGKHVAGVAGEQAGQVASEATHQVKQLVSQTRSELTEQAAAQQQRVASGLRALSKELSEMAQASEHAGMATELVQQVGDRTETVASWLQNREPGHVVDEVTRFARQRPGVFLALAAGAGLLVGRLGRNLKAANDDGNDSTSRPTPTGPPSQQDVSRLGYDSTPGLPTPTYPPGPSHEPGGYRPAPGYQQAPGQSSYDPTPAQRPAPAYPSPAPNYPPQTSERPQGLGGQDRRP
ncbi:hypothetical protein BH10ACT9_BH10ACT9_46050 [soil metagenome]